MRDDERPVESKDEAINMDDERETPTDTKRVYVRGDASADAIARALMRAASGRDGSPL